MSHNAPRASQPAWRRRLPVQLARKAVQLAFLALFLYPLLPVIVNRLTYQPVPTWTSWLLPWDPLLLAGHLLRRHWTGLVIGAPLLLLAATWILGRFFCGWVCPLGTVLDLIHPLALWQRRQGWSRRRIGWFPLHGSGPLRYYLLVAVLASSVVSLKLLGLLDPLVIFEHAATVIVTSALALQLPPLRLTLAAPVVFLLIVALELWQPRFWCRHLCPLGALLSVFARGGLLQRRIDTACTNCGECRRGCPMRAIPDEQYKLCQGDCSVCEGCEWGAALLKLNLHQTYYVECILCLECAATCPEGAVRWTWPKLTEHAREYAPPSAPAPLQLSRRAFLGGIIAGTAGLAFPTAMRGAERRPVLRPPGALPEPQFIHTCIACQECVRACPAGALQPVLFEAGLAAFGTPRLVPAQGACSLDPSCPDLCAAVCPVGAILPVTPQEMKIGLAKVQHDICLGWAQETKCLICVETCVAGAAKVHNGKVIVDPARCTGCGRCEHACPIPGSAIRVYPL